MSSMALGRKVWILYILTLSCFSVHCQREYNMDSFSTCGSTINADDNGVRLNARGTVSSVNPPMDCVVYVRSVYTRKDGTNKLQIEVESLVIRDSAITVDIFAGRTTTGRYIKRLSYREGSTAIIYAQTNELTVRLSRPDVLYQPNYRFSLLIKPWKDRNVLPPNDGKESISTGAIIGIVFGCLFLIALIILFCWCYCTGRVSGSKGILKDANRKDSPGIDNKAVGDARGKPGLNNFKDPVVWNTVSTGNFENRRIGRNYYQRNAPQYNYRNGGRNGEYEPYEFGRPQEGRGYNGQGYNQRYEPSQNTGRENSRVHPTATENQQRQPTRETLIDDVFESDSGNQDGDTVDTDVDDVTLQKRPLEGKSESPKQDRKNDSELPEEKKLDGSPHLERYKSMDLQSQPDLDTISSPLHINAGVRASVEDDDISPTSSLRRQKKGGRSPKLKGRGEREPDPSAMPPEAFEPIFSAPITGINYPAYRDEVPPAYPGGFMPYGLIPAMHFAPSAPGAQTYAYAYQTAPTGGPPATQGAYVVQNVPTSDGNRRTAFAVEHTLSPERSNIGTSSKDRRKNGNDPFHHNENRNSNGSKQGRGRHKDHDLAVISRGAAPPDPGPGHRSMAMKSGTDPDTGIQTSQVVWTDTVPDPTDPKPGENPQITRKTITRVTTKSGHGELPPEPNPLLALDDAEPEFLSPSRKNVLSPSHPNAAIQYTPDRGNIAFYTGAGSNEVPPERSSTPNSVHHATSYNKAIRDRIPLDDSTV